MLSMYKLCNTMLPAVFNDMRIHNYDIHSYFTCYVSNLQIQKHSLNIMSRTVRINGTNLYNYVKKYIFIDSPIGMFKRSLRNFLFNNDVPRML